MEFFAFIESFFRPVISAAKSNPDPQQFLLPLSAIFVAANFAFVAISHVKDVLEDSSSDKMMRVLISLPIIAALCSIFSSSYILKLWPGDHSYHAFGFLGSVVCLVVTYFLVMGYCGYKYSNLYKKKRAKAAALYNKHPQPPTDTASGKRLATILSPLLEKMHKVGPRDPIDNKLE